ncbi:MAG: dipeptide ABC transporter ATP-binding protein [Burkholderiales bacterium]|nr:dipeptide ABC transporter ATP-binding protein [Burkholderiales bacterium]
MITIADLRVELDTDSAIVRAIDALRLTIERGETFALVGESGCGKSMTALALMRLLPENGRVSAGRVLLDEQDLLDLPEARMRAVRGGRIGMIFQEPSTSLNPVMRVGEQIVEAIEAHTELRGAAARAKAIEWLGRVGIPEPERRIDDYPFRMSGGQKQRVMIAIALAAEPDFLVADEPTTALDVSIQAQILELLKDLQRQQRMGLLLITHDLAVVSGMAHRVALMYAGQIVELAPAAEFFRAPRHPYAAALLRALPGADRRQQTLEAIPGTVPALSQDFAGCRFAPRCAQVMPHCASTLPELVTVGAGHEVRCLLYTPDAGPRTQAAAAPSASAADDPAATTAARPAAAAATKTPLLQVRDLWVRFPVRGGGLLQRRAGSFDAVQGVSFEVERAQTLALVGESGCGKTTTGKAIVQLLRRIARVEGRALLEGRNLLELQGADLHAARGRVQIIFQDPFASLNPRMRVLEVLEEGLAALQPGLAADERRARIEALVERVGLRRDALERFPHEFSGGQRQRIAIARALAVQPQLIVCDEPTSALDVSVQAQILNLLRELQRELGVSYLFITHNIGVVEYIADRVAVMRAGRIEEQGEVDQVLGAPTTAYTRALLAAVPRLRGVVTPA